MSGSDPRSPASDGDATNRDGCISQSLPQAVRRANSAHIRPPRPDYGLNFQAKGRTMFYDVPKRYPRSPASTVMLPIEMGTHTLSLSHTHTLSFSLESNFLPLFIEHLCKATGFGGNPEVGGLDGDAANREGRSPRRAPQGVRPRPIHNLDEDLGIRAYRGISFIRKTLLLGPYSRTDLGSYGGHRGGGRLPCARYPCRDHFKSYEPSPDMRGNSISEQLLRRNAKRFRGGLVVKAHRLVYHSTLSRVIKKKKKKIRGNVTFSGTHRRKGSNFSSKCSAHRDTSLTRISPPTTLLLQGRRHSPTVES